MSEKEQEARRALNALFIAVPEDVARDVQTKVLAWFDELKSKE
jgi:hypothetical protein